MEKEADGKLKIKKQYQSKDFDFKTFSAIPKIQHLNGKKYLISLQVSKAKKDAFIIQDGKKKTVNSNDTISFNFFYDEKKYMF